MFVRKISATTTCAEISESDQERAAQRAYDASRQEYEDVGRDAQRDVDAATALRDAAIEIELDLIGHE